MARDPALTCANRSSVRQGPGSRRTLTSAPSSPKSPRPQLQSSPFVVMTIVKSSPAETCRTLLLNKTRSGRKRQGRRSPCASLLPSRPPARPHSWTHPSESRNAVCSPPTATATTTDGSRCWTHCEVGQPPGPWPIFASPLWPPSFLPQVMTLPLLITTDICDALPRPIQSRTLFTVRVARNRSMERQYDGAVSNGKGAQKPTLFETVRL